MLGVWIVLVGGALLAASALDSPVGQGARDAAQPAAPGAVEAPADPAAALPPLALVLDRELPAQLSGRAPVQQAEDLRVLAMTTRSPERFVELGSLLQQLGDVASAEASYRAALRFDPDSLEAQVGLAMVQGAGGAQGLTTAADRLRELAAQNPDSQLVHFNLGWVEVYRRRAEPASEAWQRTIALGAGTRLGGFATQLLKTLENTGDSRNP